MGTVRHPAVAGRFYPGKPEALAREVHSHLASGKQKLETIGCIVPHAGYVYSGHVAGAVYSQLMLPRRYIILCPNHTGLGEPLSVMSDGEWLTPLGAARVDRELGAALRDSFHALREDSVAHQDEHATEVQLPFLQALVPDFSFVPINVGTSRLEVLEILGGAIAAVVQQAAEPVLVVASSDMNHYEDDNTTRIKDSKALERVLALDARGLHEVVTTQNISMCGFGPAVAMLTAAKQLGAHKARLIKYATSADVSGDRDWCVGYAGVAITP